MSKSKQRAAAHDTVPTSGKREYRQTLRALQIELVKLQKYFIRCNDKILVPVEGRDAAGKDGLIKRIVQHLSPRETRIVALGKPIRKWFFNAMIRTSATA
jgi:polyphosphate kinase 2 (PPK2 family)